MYQYIEFGHVCFINKHTKLHVFEPSITMVSRADVECGTSSNLALDRVRDLGLRAESDCAGFLGSFMSFEFGSLQLAVRLV